MLRICPKCKRTVVTDGTPKYCPWGCGSLIGTTIYNIEEYYQIKRISNRIKPKKIQKIETVNQLKLF